MVDRIINPGDWFPCVAYVHFRPLARYAKGENDSRSLSIAPNYFRTDMGLNKQILTQCRTLSQQ